MPKSRDEILKALEDLYAQLNLCEQREQGFDESTSQEEIDAVYAAISDIMIKIGEYNDQLGI